MNLPRRNGPQKAPNNKRIPGDWRTEQFKLLVLYRSEWYSWLTEGKSLPRTPNPRGPDVLPRTRRRKGVAA